MIGQTGLLQCYHGVITLSPGKEHDVRHMAATNLRPVTHAPAPVPEGAPAPRPALDAVGVTLLDAAGHILAEEGAGALTVRRIASDAGMSTMNVYSRFGGKHGVVEHLFLQGFALLAHSMGEVPVSADPVADLRECGLAYRRFALEHSTLYAVMFEKAVPDWEPSWAALESGLATLQHLADRILRCMQAGRFRTAEPLHVAGIVWSTCHGAVSLELKQKLAIALDWEAVYRDACDVLVRGLAA